MASEGFGDAVCGSRRLDSQAEAVPIPPRVEGVRESEHERMRDSVPRRDSRMGKRPDDGTP